MVYIFCKTFQVSQCEDYVEDECKVEVKDVCNEYTDTKWVWFIPIQFHVKIWFICIFVDVKKCHGDSVKPRTKMIVKPKKNVKWSITKNVKQLLKKFVKT